MNDTVWIEVELGEVGFNEIVWIEMGPGKAWLSDTGHCEEVSLTGLGYGLW